MLYCGPIVQWNTGPPVEIVYTPLLISIFWKQSIKQKIPLISFAKWEFCSVYLSDFWLKETHVFKTKFVAKLERRSVHINYKWKIRTKSFFKKIYLICNSNIRFLFRILVNFHVLSLLFLEIQWYTSNLQYVQKVFSNFHRKLTIYM